MTEPNLWLCAILIFAGMAGHFIKKLADLQNAGTLLTPLEFARQQPYTVALAVIGAYLLAAFWYFVGQLNEVSAILTGIGCGSAFDSLRARAAGRMQQFQREGQNSGV